MVGYGMMVVDYDEEELEAIKEVAMAPLKGEE